MDRNGCDAQAADLMVARKIGSNLSTGFTESGGLKNGPDSRWRMCCFNASITGYASHPQRRPLRIAKVVQGRRSRIYQVSMAIRT